MPDMRAFMRTYNTGPPAVKGTPPPLVDSRRNRLLGALQHADWQALTPWMEFSELAAGQVLHQGGGTIRQVYFPISCVVGLVQVLADGASAQTALVGSEAAAGLSVFLGSDLAPCLTLVQSAGQAVAIDAALLKQEFRRAGHFMDLTLHCLQALMAQQAQTVVCSRHHTLEQQLCRWLLSSLDRIDASELAVTHEFIASMLGVRRESITEAAHRLQHRGLVHAHRGHLEVVDRPGVQQAACECYAPTKRHYESVLPQA
jgi:CRP-like cAMP-binding protein